MADFVDDEAEESEEEQDLNPREKKRAKKARAMQDSDEEEDDDEARYREELKDFVDDNLIESDAEDSDEGNETNKRKKSDDEDFDDRLEDDDYDLLEENLGISVKRKRFKRLRRIEDRESDEDEQQPVDEREAIANELFDAGSGDDEERQSVRSHRPEREMYNEEGSEGEVSDADDFIVDEDDRPITEKRRKKRPVFSDAALQEAQDIFGVDFDYDEIEKYGRDGDEEEDEVDDYADEEGLGERPSRSKKASNKKTTKKTIFEIYEPCELQRGHFTDRDNEIRVTDIPERMQTRSVPVTPVPEGSNELELEAEWIYKQAFCRPTISIQDAHLSDEAKERACKGPQTVPKIKKALDFMRNQNFEVPFIAFYRKEYVLPELNINDLWKVYRYDAKWCELHKRKENLLTLFERMRDYQLDEVMKNPDAPLPESVRIIKEDDIDRLKNVETGEELNDVHHHFMLYYGNEAPKMQALIREREKFALRQEKLRKKRQLIADAIERGEDPPPDEEEDIEFAEPECDETLKQAVKSGSYALCQKAGLDEFAKKFGLTPEQFGENVRDNYQRHEVEQDPTDPFLTALDSRSKLFDDPEEILKAVQLMVAIQLARDPLVRKCVREMYMERAKMSVRPTKKGIKEIDENHPIYAMKYLKDKPVKELVGDEFLKLTIAEKDKLVELAFSDFVEGNTSDNFVDEMKQLYHRDEFSKNVQDWNALRIGAAEQALTKMVIPDMKKELRSNLLAESKEFVLRACCRKMYNWIKDAPYRVNFDEETPLAANEDDWDSGEQTAPKTNDKAKDPEWDTSKGIRVMGLAYVPDFSQAAFACLISPDGECTDYLKIPHLLKRKTSFREDERAMKEEAMKLVENFILTKKPHVVVIGGESREATMLSEDLKECITTLMTEEQFPAINVEICDNELAKIYANSSKGNEEFREYPVLLRQAISMARRLQDPLIEFSQLCTSDDEILCLKYHQYQDEISKEDLLENLQLEFVNRVNEVGVDVNKAIGEGYSGNVVQFVCGLGSRKAQALIKMLKQTNQRIENRTQLVTVCHMGPKIFINCAGFVKIDTASLGDSTEAYVEVLDGSRVHPETYEWARKMAVDALEYDDDEEANPAGAVEEIIHAPERLKDLDLDAFAEELERQGFGDKCTTLYDIRAELNCRYKDLRAPYESPTPEKLFDMLTKETPETFYIGKLIMATVSGLNYRKPEGEQLDQANPVRNDETGLWQCPFCMKNDFPELSEVWSHFDAGTCPGKAIGVRLRLDNGISGYIHIRNLSDKHVKHPEERVRAGQVIYCRIIKIEVDRFGIECTSKSSDLADKNNELRPQRDPYYDIDAEERDIRTEEDAKKSKQQRAYIKRVIVHPAFHNISYSEAAKLMEAMKQGETIVRPSSKGEDHLTVTWKVTEDVLHHIDVREEGKKFGFSLGKRLWIGAEEFEDLDEIIARHVNPMAAYAAELLECHYFTPNVDGVEAKAEQVLNEKKKNKPSSIPVIISPSKTYPAKFMLSYQPRERCLHEYVSVSPDGVRFRGQTFPTIGKMFTWFKKHFREIPKPVATPKTPFATPGLNQESWDDNHSCQTPGLGGDEMSYSFSVNTPAAGGYGGAQSYPNTPYTPSGPTPFLTPYQTPLGTPQATPMTPGSVTSSVTSKVRKTPSAGPNFLADADARSTTSGSWKQKPDGTFSFTNDDVDDDAMSSVSNSRSSFRGRGSYRGDGGFRGRGDSRGGGGGFRGRGGDFRGRGDWRGRGNSSFRGGRGGRGDSRGGRGNSRNSYNNSYGGNSTSNSNTDFNRSNNHSATGGNTTPLWDESENWDSPGTTSKRNESATAKTPSNTNVSMGNRTPLWDESENWDSPGQASLPDASTTSVASNAAPVVASSGSLFGNEENWDDADTTPARNNTQTSAQVSSQPPPFRGSGNNFTTPSSARPRQQQTFRGGVPRNNSGAASRAAPPTASGGSLFGNEENWDDDEPAPAKATNFGAASAPQVAASEPTTSPRNSRPQPPTSSQPQQSSSRGASSGSLFGTEENWDDDDAPTTTARTVPTPPACPPAASSSFNSAPSSSANRQATFDNSGYNSDASSCSGREYSRGGRQFNNNRGGTSRPTHQQSFRGGAARNNYAQSNGPRNNFAQSNSSRNNSAPSTASGGSLFGNEENWDDDAPTPAKTVQTPACPPANFASSNAMSRQTSADNSGYNSDASNSSGRQYSRGGRQMNNNNRGGSSRPPSQQSFRGGAARNNYARSAAAPSTASGGGGSLFGNEENWDDDDASTTAKNAQTSARPPAANSPFNSAPSNAASRQAPSESSGYNSSRGGRQFNNYGGSSRPPSQQSFGGGAARNNSAPSIAPSTASGGSSLFGDEENWDDDAPTSAKTVQTPACPPANLASSSAMSRQTPADNSGYNSDASNSSGRQYSRGGGRQLNNYGGSSRPSSQQSFRGGAARNNFAQSNAPRNNSAPSIAPSTASGGSLFGDEENWDDDAPTPAKTVQAPAVNSPFTSAPPSAANRQPPSGSFQSKSAPPSTPIVATTSGPQWGSDENWDDDGPSTSKSVQQAPSIAAFSQPPNRQSSRDGPHFKSPHFQSRGNSQYNNSPNIQCRQPPRGGASQYSSSNTPAAKSAPASSTCLFGNSENWDDDDAVAPKTSQTMMQTPSRPPPTISNNNSAPNWGTNESWDDDEPTKKAAPSFPTTTNSSSPAFVTPNKPFGSGATPYSAGPPSLPFGNDTENWDDDGGNKNAASKPPTMPTSRNFAAPMSAPPPPRQFSRNNDAGAARGSYRQYRQNNNNGRGGAAQGSYREYKENKERAAAATAGQGSYRQHRESLGGTAAATTPTPYQRPPRNDETSMGRSPYQQQQQYRCSDRPTSSSQPTLPANVLPNDSNTKSSNAASSSTNLKSLFGESESWD